MYYQNNAYGNGNNLGYGLGLGLFDWSNTNAQLSNIQGKIIDGSTNKPLSPTNIYYTKNGKKVGVITNINGEYELQASPTDIITISFIGFESIIVPASEIRAIEYLYPMNVQLEEVIVTATKTPPKTTKNNNLIIGFGVLAAVVIASIASKKEYKNPKTT